MSEQRRKVLITGADGFIGSHMTELWADAGHEVRAVVQYNARNSWGCLEDARLTDAVEVVAADIRDPFQCRALARDIDVILNLAALIAIPYSYEAPSSYIDTNISGTNNLCQAAREEGCMLVQFSTSEVYGSARYVPMDEAHPLTPQSPYSASKIGSDSIALSYHYSFELPVIVVRPFNTFGPRQSARAVIPTIITQALSGKRTLRLGSLTPTRDLNFVTDICRAVKLLSETPSAIGQVVNIGTGVETSVGRLVEIIGEQVGVELGVEEDAARIRPAGSEVDRLCCDNSRLVELTGFEFEHTVETGLARAIEWFGRPENLGQYKPDVYNV